MAGRNKKPSALKQLQGNPGRRPLDADEPMPIAVTTAPRAPKNLGDVGRAKWRELTQYLIDARVLTVVDLFRLERHCGWAELYQMAKSKLVKEEDVVLSGGTGAKYQSPWVNILSMAEKALSGTESEFGMTPVSRTKVKVVNPKQRSLFEDLDDDDADSVSPVSDFELTRV